MKIDGKEYVKAEEAMRALYVTSYDALKAWRKAGIPCIKNGYHYYYNLDDCHKWFRTTGGADDEA